MIWVTRSRSVVVMTVPDGKPQLNTFGSLFRAIQRGKQSPFASSSSAMLPPTLLTGYFYSLFTYSCSLIPAIPHSKPKT